MSVTSNLQRVKSVLPDSVKLVAVSKFHPAEIVREAYDAGQRRFGESRAQELVEKSALLPPDIEWHFIGSLQKNKVKRIAPFIHTIQSVDSWGLLAEINKQALECNRIIHVLLEIHVAREETKSGLTFTECRALLASEEVKACLNIHIDGLMCMATNTADEQLIRLEFRSLGMFFDDLKRTYFRGNDCFRELSMGMSQDYPIAIQEGCTMVRVGTSIFGEREY